LGTVVLLGWEKAFGSDEEFAGGATAVEGAQFL